MTKIITKFTMVTFAIFFLVAGNLCLSSQKALAANSSSTTKGGGKKLYEIAFAKIKKGKYISAIEDLKKALKTNEKNADLWSLYGFAARKAGSYDLAEKAYERALSLDPKHLAALEYSGELYLEMSKPELVQERLERLNKLCPQGCRELSLLKKAIMGQGNDGTHKVVEPNW